MDTTIHIKTFKEYYLEYFNNIIKELTPNGYEIKVIDELSFGNGLPEPGNLIMFIVRFGAGQKMMDAIGTYTQPITITCYSEEDSHSVSMNILQSFFELNSMRGVIVGTYSIVGSYTTPTIVKAFNKIQGMQRSTILLSGIISYTTDLIVGTKYYLNDIEISPISATGTFNSAVSSPPLNDNLRGLGIAEGMNSGFGLVFYLKDDSLFKLVMNAVYNIDNITEQTLNYKITRKNEEFIIDCTITSILDEYELISGRTKITINLMPRMELT